PNPQTEDSVAASGMEKGGTPVRGAHSSTALQTGSQPVSGVTIPDVRAQRPAGEDLGAGGETLSQRAASSEAAGTVTQTASVVRSQTSGAVALRMRSADSTVNVQLKQRGGAVEVSVRSDNPQLAKALQTDLGDLVGRLSERGYKAETWSPAESHHAAPGG